MRHHSLLLFVSLLSLVAAQELVHNSTYNFPTTQQQSPSTTHNATFSQCHDVRYAPKGDQCLLATTLCGDYKIGFVNYVSLYYCGGTRFVTFIAYVLLLACLFTTLGITASEFLCPNLDTIAKFFRISESLAGVTLLALGNGSPDVFSTLEAMKIGSADLALSELVGAALFITAVVVGSMAIVKPFKVVKRPFIRDVVFLLLSVTLTAVFLSDGEISLLEAIVMIVLYGCYVVFVVSWDWVVTKKRRVQLLDQKVRNHFFDDASRYNLAHYQVEESNEINDEDILSDLNASSVGIEVLDEQLAHESESWFDEWTRRSTIQRIRPSILGAMDFNTKMHDFQDVPPPNSAISLATLPGRLNSEATRALPSIQMSSAPTFRDNEDDDDEYRDYEARTMSAPAAYGDPFRDELSHEMDFNSNYPDLIDAHNALKGFLEHNNVINDSSLFFNFFPTLKGFKHKPVSDKIMGILCLPSVTVLRLTIPVITTEDKKIDTDTALGKGFLLLIFQCLFSPFATTFLIFYEDKLTTPLIVMPVMISVVLITLAFTLRKFHKQGLQTLISVFTCVLACLGFIIAINWISTIATELIAIIKFFAVFFDLSDAILGVTIFAIGNSLGDFISNFTIAKMGFPTMALSACFGGPLLNVLLGIGGSAIYVIPLSGENIEVHVSKTLIVSGVALLVNLLALLVMVPVNGWYINKPIGVFMIGLWGVATFICVILEMVG